MRAGGGGQGGSAYLLLDVAGTPCALPRSAVAEILPLPELHNPPAAGGWLSGFLNLGGSPIPVVDLAALLGLRPPVAEPGLYAHLVLTRGETLAYLVDRVADLVTVPEAAMAGRGGRDPQRLRGGRTRPRRPPRSRACAGAPPDHAGAFPGRGAGAGRRRAPRGAARIRLTPRCRARVQHPVPILADPAYAELKARIIARTGHHYYIDKDDLLVERLRRRFRATSSPDCAAYAALLADGELGETEWACLEAEITVGETFFFRYAEQFQALRETILPGLIAAREAERSLRIWSAGCSTGAETYSLAILVREALGEALPDWRIAILGTDISTEALATARAADTADGPCGRCLRRTGCAISPACRPRPASGARRICPGPEFRTLVRFERGNLLSLVEPGPPQGEKFDLILCRNVLIYFDARTVAAVVRGLSRRLRDDGWLLLGHAEPSPAFAAFLNAVSLPGTVAYRRHADALPAPPTWPVPPRSSRRCRTGTRDCPLGQTRRWTRLCTLPPTPSPATSRPRHPVTRVVPA